jgi:hypothetical protein
MKFIMLSTLSATNLQTSNMLRNIHTGYLTDLLMAMFQFSQKYNKNMHWSRPSDNCDRQEGKKEGDANQ